ncbi:hypothetical protein An12g08880 [Aspergillus niger]|uniref:Uncharacterized protein n=2 Tax=Aspergillus niger TaxID=5061 RepID=A2R0K0_ASPNC|nr:hypothetical protein An12g08880 [Aspergillus niger]CAK41338.1 hypothetical protein An12g08880 [Aspergillus niger]
MPVTGKESDQRHAIQALTVQRDPTAPLTDRSSSRFTRAISISVGKSLTSNTSPPSVSSVLSVPVHHLDKASVVGLERAARKLEVNGHVPDTGGRRMIMGSTKRPHRTSCGLEYPLSDQRRSLQIAWKMGHSTALGWVLLFIIAFEQEIFGIVVERKPLEDMILQIGCYWYRYWYQ